MRLVYVPEPPSLMWEEVLRRHPRTVLQEYGGELPRPDRRSAVVAFCCDQPPYVPRRGGGVALGMTDPARRAVLVFTRDLRLALRLRRWDDPRLDVAIGRVIAHELEHLRRGSGAHDRRGWFRACASPADLLS